MFPISLLLLHKISEPQIYIAFYEKLDPTIVQMASKDWLNYENQGSLWVDQLGTYSLGKYLFTSIDAHVFENTNTVILATPLDVDKKMVPEVTIYYPDQTPAYYIFTTQNLFAKNE